MVLAPGLAETVLLDWTVTKKSKLKNKTIGLSLSLDNITSVFNAYVEADYDGSIFVLAFINCMRQKFPSIEIRDIMIDDLCDLISDILEKTVNKK